MGIHVWQMCRGLIVAALLAAPASAGLPILDAERIESYRTYGFIGRTAEKVEPLTGWHHTLQAALKNSTPDKAASKLAPVYGLAVGDMRELVELWLVLDAYGADADQDRPLSAELRSRFVGLVQRTKFAPLVVEAASAGFEMVESCSAAEYSAMTSGASDLIATGWLLVRSAPLCPAWQGAFIAAAPEKRMAALYQIAATRELADSDLLPLYALLRTPASLAHVDAKDRALVQADIERRLIGKLFEAGFAEEGIAEYEGLPPTIRGLVRNDTSADTVIRIDGLDAPFMSGAWDDLDTVNLAAAYFVTGRRAEAETVYGTIPTLAAARAHLDCAYAEIRPVDQPSACPKSVPNGSLILYLDFLLHRPGDDPYPLLEATAGDKINGQGGVGVRGEVFCRLFPDPQYGGPCHGSPADGDSVSEWDKGYAASQKAVLATANITEYEALRTRYRQKREAASGGRGGSPTPVLADEAPLSAAPPAFAAQPLAKNNRKPPAVPHALDRCTPPDLALPKDMTDIGGSFRPLRIERNDSRVAVISVSSAISPAGCTSFGAIWVHLSTDGGKTWRRPLLTGLTDTYPYIVVTESKLPLWTGEVLKIEVDEVETDPRSIAYPMVDLAVMRHRTGMVVEIPLAALERDSDGDGLTDILERHLLLDPDNPDSDGDGLPDGVDPFPNVSAKMAAPLPIVTQLTAAALRSCSVQPGPAPLSPGVASVEPEIVAGDPADFVGLSCNRPVLVYGKDDLARFARRLPRFEGDKIGKPVYNRAGDRGFIVIDGTSAGRTFRVRRVDGKWITDTLSAWIT